ncbi:hypothetical protein D3C81_2299890 [compost metagenome]
MRAEGQVAEADAMLWEAIAAFEHLGARLDLVGLRPTAPPEILCADSMKPKAR